MVQKRVLEAGPAGAFLRGDCGTASDFGHAIDSANNPSLSTRSEAGPITDVYAVNGLEGAPAEGRETGAGVLTITSQSSTRETGVSTTRT